MDPRRAGTGYLALPDDDQGPGVLVLHAWWGLTPAVRAVCDQLADAGFVALAPDLFDGVVAETISEAEAHLGSVDANELAHRTRSSLQTLLDLPATTGERVGLLGYSMGASMALWLAARVPAPVAATAVYYGSQDIDMGEATSAFLGHYLPSDPYVDDDELALLEAELHLDGLSVEFHRYPGVDHWFAESDRPEYNLAAATLAWDRTLAFLATHLPRPGGPPVA
jgi:carboxymethylenebutenolidase